MNFFNPELKNIFLLLLVILIVKTMIEIFFKKRNQKIKIYKKKRKNYKNTMTLTKNKKKQSLKKESLHVKQKTRPSYQENKKTWQ